MKYIFVLLGFLVSACATLPDVPPPAPVVVAPPAWPAAPDQGLTPCSDLTPIPTGATITDLAKTVVADFGLYHDCRAKLEVWIQWYGQQMKIYNSSQPVTGASK